MTELFFAGITSLDVVAVYAFLHVKKGKFKLALWTSFLNMAFPFLGFVTGEWSTHYFSGWTTLLSGVLLSLIGIHMLLQGEDEEKQRHGVNPMFIALAVSVDTFSVSVSFGMLQMNKTIFILASGFITLVLSYLTLRFKAQLGVKNGKWLRRIAGTVLLVMGILSCLR
ncbi:manganese efflux pump MntP [Sporosarcina sp. G11-34]|uniref:manganese efflux pump MntP n=1 Tax=Sporosarcina sp. G11-34 TaxID=2849605 RepID=UPI0022A98165|nr:manganese efflux pump [Sporosarcina sp. G11-34]MCZ2257528.1 manganese efflux pump MntP family protein [Sporosarcina sp. G11-34]